MMIYGDSGVGKTRLAGSASEVPDLSPLLYIDAEGGTLTLRNLYPEIETVRVDSWGQLKNIHDELKHGNHGYNTVVLDSVTEIQKLGMSYTMDVRHGGNELAVPEIKEWNINIEQARNHVRMFRDLQNVNSIFTALVRVDTDKRTQMSRKKPSLSGKVADEVAGFLDIVTYLYVEEVDKVNTRILLTGNTAGTVAKDRTDSLPFQMGNPTMTKIFECINGRVPSELQA